MPAPGPPGDVTQAGPAASDARAGVVRAPQLRAALAALGRRRRLAVACLLLLGLAAAGAALAEPYVRAWHHLRAARAALEAYHTPEAVRHLQEVRRVWPDD